MLCQPAPPYKSLNNFLTTLKHYIVGLLVFVLFLGRFTKYFIFEGRFVLPVQFFVNLLLTYVRIGQ